MSYTVEDRDYLAAIIYGEARGESEEGQAAVAHVVLNRVENTDQTIQQVATDEHQFTALSPRDPNRGKIEAAAQANDAEWQNAQAVATAVLSGEIPDPTGGADHYYNPDEATPRWSPQLRETAVIGGHRFGTLPWNTPNPSTNFAPLNFGDQPEIQTAQASIGEVFGPPAPVNSPPLPATPSDMAAALTQQPGQRSLAGYIAEQEGLSSVDELLALVAPGQNPRVARGVPNLRPETQERVLAAVGMLPAELQQKVQITSTLRDEHETHRHGGAVDLRNNTLTPIEEAQLVAALAASGFEAIGPYADGSLGPGSPAHIHAGDDTQYNRAGSVFQAQRRTDNPFLAGTLLEDMDTGVSSIQGGLYDALDNGSAVSDAWFGATVPNPTRSARADNLGDGSLDAILSTQRTRLSGSPTDHQYAAQNARERAANPPPSEPRFSVSDAAGVAPANSGSVGSGVSAPSGYHHEAQTTERVSRVRGDSSPRLSESDGIWGAFSSAPARSSSGDSGSQRNPTSSQVQRATPTTRASRSPTDFQYETRSVSVPNPAYAAWEKTQTNPQLRSPTDFQYAAQNARTLARNAPPQTITRQERVRVPVPNPVPAPVVPQRQTYTPPNPTPSPQTQSGGGSAFQSVNNFLNSIFHNSRPSVGTNAPGFNSGAGGSVVMPDQPSRSSGGSSGGGGGTVICTYFYKKGEINRLEYGANVTWTARHVSDQTYRGYHFWAVPYVKLMRKSPLAEKLMLPILKARTNELLFRLGKRKKGSLGGKLARLVLESMSWVFGAFVSEQDWTHLWKAESHGG